MALDFGILQPVNIAGQMMAGQQQAQQNQLAQQQLKQSQISTQHSQMQMEQLQRDRDALVKLQQQFVANGKSPDLEENFNAMIQSGIPHFVDIGTQGLQRVQQQKAFASIMGGGGAAPAATPAAAPVAPVPAGALGSGTYDPTAAVAPVNALARSSAAPAAPVNALAAPQPAGNPLGGNVDALRQKRDALLGMGTQQSIAAAKALDADIAIASREPVFHNVPGVGLVDPRTGKVIVESKESTQPEIKQYEYAKAQGYKGSLFDFKREMAQAGRPAGTTVNLPPQEKAEQGARGTLLVKEYGDISSAAKLAAKTLPAIEANLNILNNGFKTGFGTESIAAGANVLSALGVPNAEKFATNAQTFLGSATQAVLQKQLEQKGPQTESDAQRIQQTGAQLGNTVQANQFMLSTAKAQLKRDMDQRNFYDSWWKQNKTYDGAESAWYAGEGGKSLFDRPELKAYKQPTAASTAAAEARPSLDKIFGKRP